VLDNLALQVQSVNDKVNRAPKLSASTPVVGSVSLALNANGLLYVNSAGTGILSTTESYTSVAGNLATLAPIASDISAVAAIDTEISAVAADIADVSTVAANIADVSAVADNIANVAAVGAIAADVATVATNIAAVQTVAANMATITAAANNIPKNNLSATADPTVNDDTGDGYQIGSYWVNATTGHLYFATAVTLGAAVWKRADFATLQQECINAQITTVANKDYQVMLDAPYGGTITSIVTQSASGTCTLTGKINTTPLGGTANSVSSTKTSQAHSSANTFVAGDKIVLTASANSACTDMAVTIKFNRTIG